MSELEERTAAFNVEIREEELGDEKCVVDMADNMLANIIFHLLILQTSIRDAKFTSPKILELASSTSNVEIIEEQETSVVVDRADKIPSSMIFYQCNHINVHLPQQSSL